MHGVGIDIAAKLARDVGFARKLEEFGAIGREQARIARGCAEDLGETRGAVSARKLRSAAVARGGGEKICGVSLRRLPAVERVAVMRHQELDPVRHRGRW